MDVRSSVVTGAPTRRAAAIAGGFRVPSRLVAAVVFLAIWFGASSVLPKFAAPSPLIVAEVLVQAVEDGILISQTVATLSRTLIGLTVAMILGTAVGVAMGVSRYLDHYLRIWVTFGLAVPGAVWVLVMVLWFGINVAAALVTIVLITAPYIVINIYEGVKNIDKSLLDMARSFQVPGPRRLSKIILPGMAPFILGALRQSVASAWRVAAVAELFAAADGVGYMIRVAFESFQIRGIIAWALVLGVIIIALEYLVITPVQRRLLSWRPEAGEIF